MRVLVAASLAASLLLAARPSLAQTDCPATSDPARRIAIRFVTEPASRGSAISLLPALQPADVQPLVGPADSALCRQLAQRMPARRADAIDPPAAWGFSFFRVGDHYLAVHAYLGSPTQVVNGQLQIRSRPASVFLLDRNLTVLARVTG